MIRFSLRKKLKSTEGEMILEAEGEVSATQFVALMGPSGAGKTSILRMLAGLMKPDHGFIEVDGETWFDSKSKKDLPPQKRNTGYVSQIATAFPNMTVKENLLYALSGAQDKSIATELLKAVGLVPFENGKTSVLSGGQLQRLMIARALVRKPKILLLDEPLSALDFTLRRKLQDHISSIHRKYNLTTILVSHEAGEVFRMADKVFVLDHGKISQQGSPVEVFSDHRVTGKFQFTGEIVDIKKEDVIYVVSVLIGNQLVKVVADASEITDFSPGDKVMVASKAFNPIIQKIKND